ncbi:E3 ubiquitin-protein ligase TRIM71-like [Topomyia yanbarensis]|uniref:E3 ubiquitin-protein ligase TRIM71-like n=1 Tax=Topomyia yanbarensis TaxID=2498891 RepID=UPI00273BD5D7|nr:E3 ubiquitin-protein ligase TRIM71-like [Topomyia yanbarensis]
MEIKMIFIGDNLDLYCDCNRQVRQFFCCHCQELFCDSCTSGQHFDHTFQSLDKILTPNRDDDEQQQQQAMDLEQNWCKVKTSEKSVEASVSDIQKSIAALDIRREKQ